MTHYTDEDLILYYYGEAPDRGNIARHLAACRDCSTTYRALEQTLGLIPVSPVPDRDESYPLYVWQRLRGRLDQDVKWWHEWFAWKPVSIAAAFAVLVVAAFVAGRTWPRPEMHAPATAAIGSEPADTGERVRLAAIGDHLERSERVLLDLVNGEGGNLDLSAQRTWAADLVDSNRLYRDAASRAGDELVAGVLDELERSLLDLVHGPTLVTPAQLDDVRTRLDLAAVLFKVRVLADELHERETAPVKPRKTV